ncbi:MAG: transposase [Vicinamibacterales bacterium]
MATMTERRARRTRRSFTEDYKAGAVRLVLDEGKTVAAAARDLGLTESSLRNRLAYAGTARDSTNCAHSSRQSRAPTALVSG